MEAQVLDLRLLERGVEAPAQRGVLEVLAGRRDEDEVVVVDEAIATGEAVELAQDWSIIGTARPLPDIGTSSSPSEYARQTWIRRLAKVDVAPAQRAQLAQTQPAVGGDDEDRAVLGVPRALGGPNLPRQRRARVARASASTSSGVRTRKSPEGRTGWRSSPATGFEVRPKWRWARLKIACSTSRYLLIVRGARRPSATRWAR